MASRSARLSGLWAPEAVLSFLRLETSHGVDGRIRTCDTSLV